VPEGNPEKADRFWPEPRKAVRGSWGLCAGSLATGEPLLRADSPAKRAGASASWREVRSLAAGEHGNDFRLWDHAGIPAIKVEP
jgi:hypothetical protein